MRIRNPFAAPAADPGPARRRPAAPRLGVEPLEDRVVPATLSVRDVTVVEGASGVQNAAVHVTLSEPLKKTVSVSYGTSNGTAAAGSDYAAVSGQLTFARGQTDGTILVPIYGNQVPEYDESFAVRIFGPTKGVRIADGQATVTIVDSLPRLTVSSAGGYEGDVMTFTVSLSAALNSEFTVNFATADYTTDPEMLDAAFAGQDYAATSGTLTFAPGETSKTFTVQILADDLEEYDEYFSVGLSNPSAALFITGDGWGYISGEYGIWW
jgi:hypothetical protein